jgi:hypothetical protein
METKKKKISFKKFPYSSLFGCNIRNKNADKVAQKYSTK